MRILFPLLLLAFTVSVHAKDMLMFQNTYIVAPPPGVETMAAYLIAINPGDKDKEITRIDSDQFESAEIHRSSIENGIAKMQKLDRLVIPANSQVEFSPGGLHVMLTGPERPVLPGEFVMLRLEEPDGTEHILAVKVIYAGDNREEHSHH